MFWFDKNNDDVVFGDIRLESHILCDGRDLNINPSVKMDFTALPFSDSTFKVVVFDPPHLDKLGENSWMFKKYGRLSDSWRQDIKDGFSECFRVLKYDGTLIFKWNEVQIKTREILKLTDWKPFFGHLSGKRSDTHWICFLKN